MISVASLDLSGCASAPKQGTPPGTPGPVGAIQAPSGAQGSQATGNPEDYGPQPPPSADNPISTYGPEPILYRPLVLVLGPGMARGYAYVGALRALEEAKIPIAAIFGTEMGAFVGSLYAMDGKISQLEWAMLKFRDGTFDNERGLVPEVFKRKARAKKLEDGLAGVFAGRDLSQSKLPLRVVVMPKGKEPEVIERGPAASAIRAAIADPELFGAGEWEGAPAGPAPKTEQLLVGQAKALNLGPVVVIDAGAGRLAADESHDADLVIRPDLAGIGPRDFKKRTEAAFRGKNAVRQKVAELRHLVGLPNEPESEAPK